MDYSLPWLIKTVTWTIMKPTQVKITNNNNDFDWDRIIKYVINCTDGGQICNKMPNFGVQFLAVS